MDEILSMIVRLKAIEQYLPAVLFILPCFRSKMFKDPYINFVLALSRSTLKVKTFTCLICIQQRVVDPEFYQLS